LPPMHPSATCVVHEFLDHARCAAHNDDIAGVVHLRRAARTKVALELHWSAEDAEKRGDLVAAGNLHGAADRWDATVRADLYDRPRRRYRRRLAPIKIPPPLLAAGRRGAGAIEVGGRRAGSPSARAEGELSLHQHAQTPPAPPPTPTEDHTMSERAANTPPIEFAHTQPHPEHAQSVRDLATLPTAEHLSKSHQRVTLKNTDPAQTHFVRDRGLNYVQLLPGQSKELDMVSSELSGLLHLARTDRGFYESGPRKGLPFPPHPVRVVGIGPAQSVSPQTV